MEEKKYICPADQRRKVELDRFRDESGQLLPFILRPVTQEENRNLYTLCRRKDGSINRDRYLLELVCLSVEQPNLHDGALQEAYGVLGADKLLCRMLLAGEYARLVWEMRQVCGFEMDT